LHPFPLANHNRGLRFPPHGQDAQPPQIWREYDNHCRKTKRQAKPKSSACLLYVSVSAAREAGGG